MEMYFKPRLCGQLKILAYAEWVVPGDWGQPVITEEGGF